MVRRAAACAAAALALAWGGSRVADPRGILAQDALLARGGGGGAQYAPMCAQACAGRGDGVWGAGGSLRTCAVCRLARKQARVQSLGQIGTVWSTVEDDEFGVSTPTFLPAGGDDDAMVDGEGMVYFPEEFSGCFDHGDHDGFRNDRVTRPACPAPLRLPPARGGGARPCARRGADQTRAAMRPADRLRARSTTGVV